MEQLQQQFGTRRATRYKIDLHTLLEHKIPVDLSTLEGSFTLEELKTAIFDLGGDKAPGQDGFPIHFFKQFWDTIKVDLF